MNKHFKFAAMKVKNGNNESKKATLINMVMGVVCVCSPFEYFVSVCDKTASNGKRIGRAQIETVWKKEIVVRVAIFESPLKGWRKSRGIDIMVAGVAAEI
jgi:hypothetical protein